MVMLCLNFLLCCCSSFLYVVTKRMHVIVLTLTNFNSLACFLRIGAIQCIDVFLYHCLHKSEQRTVFEPIEGE